MSKITNDSLTQSGTGCFIVVPIWQQWASEGYILLFLNLAILYAFIFSPFCFHSFKSWKLFHSLSKIWSKSVYYLPPTTAHT